MAGFQRESFLTIVKAPYLLAFIPSLTFTLTNYAQNQLYERRLEVYRNPRAFSNLYSTGMWLDQYSAMLAFHQRGDYDNARRQLNLINFADIPELERAWVYIRVTRLNKRISQQRSLTEKANAELETALAQKDIIFRELHHRVKNNLANLSGLLYLQQRVI